MEDKTMRIPLINVHSPFTSYFRHSIRHRLAEGRIDRRESHNNNNKKIIFSTNDILRKYAYPKTEEEEKEEKKEKNKDKSLCMCIRFDIDKICSTPQLLAMSAN